MYEEKFTLDERESDNVKLQSERALIDKEAVIS